MDDRVQTAINIRGAFDGSPSRRSRGLGPMYEARDQ